MLKSHTLHNSTIRVKTGLCPDCDDKGEVPLIGGKCKFHYWKSKSKPIEKKVQKPIRKLSNKRSQQVSRYLKVRLEYLNDNPYCEVCGSPATEIHHKIGKIDTLLYDKRYFLAVDRKCHVRIEENPEWAKENGYSINRL